MSGHQHLTPLPDGTSVRHYGEQFPRASRDGTAVILGHFWHGVWLEYRIRRDKPFYEGGPVDSEWSADATIPINRQGHRLRHQEAQR